MHIEPAIRRSAATPAPRLTYRMSYGIPSVMFQSEDAWSRHTEIWESAANEGRPNLVMDALITAYVEPS